MLKKILISAIVCLLVIFALYTLKTCKNSDKYYLQGLRFEKEDKLQDAYYNFGKINKFSKIYPLGVYKQAKCAKKLQDYKTAIKKYEKYTSITDDETLTPVGLWELGNLYYENNRVKDAEKVFKKLENKYKDNNYAYASYFRLGEILKNDDKEKSLSYFAKYLEYAPLGRFSKKAVQNIEEINLPQDDDVKMILANSMAQNGEYDKALSYINALPQEKKWILEYKIYKSKDVQKALSIIENGLAFENNNASDEDIKDAISFYLSKKTKTDDIKRLYELTNKKGNSAHYYIGIIYAQNLSNGYNLFSDILKANSKYSDIALSEMIYLDYKNKNYKSSVRLCADFVTKYKNRNTAPKAMYYGGKSYERIGSRKQAENVYKKIIEDYPNSYYAFRAYQSLKNNPSFNLSFNKELPKRQEIKYQFQKDDMSKYLLNRLVEYDDVSTIDDFKIQDEFIKSWIAYKNRKHSYSILLAREESAKNVFKLPKTQTMLLYPLYYEDAINKYSKQNGVSPYLVIALMRKESHFDTSAKSDAGAVGLMQILPATAYFIEKGNLKDSLDSTNYNIYLGTKYLSYLKKTLNNDDMLSIASYNAGPGNVQKWASKGIQDYDIFVESIPFVETKSYVKKVFEAYWNYINLYK